MSNDKAQCSQKVRYDSYSSAKTTLKHLKQRYRKQGTQPCLEVYRCDSCRYWHIGTNSVGHRKRNKPYNRSKLDQYLYPNDT